MHLKHHKEALTYLLQLPIGGWPEDKELAENGQFVQAALLNDIEGKLAYPV
jgi:hypothetical protein